MRPPSCDVCDADVDPTETNALVACVPADRVPTDADADLPGHPEHLVWLCARHREQGRALASSRTALQVVAALREHPGLTEVVALLRRAFDRLAVDLGLDDIERERTEAREWTPMDNAEPPWCPYVDRRGLRVARNGVELELREELAHWNDDELARASVTLSVRGPASAFTVAAHTEGSSGRRLELQRFVTGDVPSWLLDEFGAPQPR